MRIERIEISGFVSIIKPFAANFVRENCIIGPNGGGKTTLFRAMAGIAGSDKATALVADEPVARVYMRLRQGKQKFEFEAEGRFCPDKIAKFKETLPHRVSFPLTEWSENFISRCVSPQEGFAQFRLFVERHSRSSSKFSEMFHYFPSSGSAAMLVGDGYRHVLWLCLNNAPKGVPVLLDNPGRHLDSVAKRLVTQMIVSRNRQLFYTTHCPEMLLHEAFRNNEMHNPHQAIIEIPLTE